MPLISIILTSYNHAKFIRESIDSVINQTFSDWELYIFDDASSDNSWEIIKSFSDNRIKIFRNLVNQGPIFAFNKVIFELSHCKYIAIHHSDDIWESNKLEKQVEFLESNPNIGAVFTNALPIDERGVALADQAHFYYKIFNQPNRSRFEWMRYFFLHGNVLCHPSILIRRQCYLECGPYLDILAQLPDFEMWIRLCAKYEIHIIKNQLVKFRILDNELNTSGNRPDTRIRSVIEQHEVHKRYRKFLPGNQIFKVFPAFSSYDRLDNTDTEFVLAMICLGSESSFLHHLLGVEILYDIFKNPERRVNIENNYNFKLNDLTIITGKYDIFMYEKNFNDKIAMDRLMSEGISLNRQIVSLNSLILEIQKSTSWRITMPLRRVASFARQIFDQIF